MAKPKKPKGNLKKRARDLVSSEYGDVEIDAAAIASLAKEPGGLAALDAVFALSRCAELGKLDAIEALVAAGADVNGRGDDDEGDPPLSAAASCSSFPSPADKARVLELLLAKGAHLDAITGHHQFSALDWAINDLDLATVKLLLARQPAPATLSSSLVAAIERIGGVKEASTAYPFVDALLAAVDDVNRPGGKLGFTPLMAAALLGDQRTLDDLVARQARLDAPLAADAVYNCGSCSPPGGGFIPQLRLSQGLTALDVVERVYEVFLAFHERYAGDGAADDYNRKQRAPIIARLERGLTWLREHGAQRGRGSRGSDVPAFVPDVDVILDHLAHAAGADVAKLQRMCEGVSLAGKGPWGYFTDVIERAAGVLLRGKLAPSSPALQQSWLGHVLLDEPRKLKVSAAKIKRADYPPEASEALKQELVAGKRDDTLLLLWKQSDGSARVCTASPTKFAVIGVDIVDFLRRQTAELLGEPVPPAQQSATAKGTGASAYALLVANYDEKPAKDAIMRVGGGPIGVDDESWPRKNGKRMFHVLTIDLEQHPSLSIKGKRAVALFVTDPGYHEAFNPSSTDARVLLLSDDDIRTKGEPGLPPELAEHDNALRAGTLSLGKEPVATGALISQSWLGPWPEWLQGDDTEHDFGDDDTGDDDTGDDDGDDDGDDADDADGASEPEEGNDRPQRFVMQFGEELVPGLNLGDAGVMYVFAECAWFQCH